MKRMRVHLTLSLFTTVLLVGGGCPPNSAQVTVPDVVGMTLTVAESVITGAGLTVGTVTEQFHVSIPVGRVIIQNPTAWRVVASGSAVALVVSIGQPILSATPPQRFVGESGGATTFSVANMGTGTMNWSSGVTSGGSWCRITSGMIGTNTGTVDVVFDDNPDQEPRTGEITFTATGAEGSPETVNVVQFGRGGANETILLPGDIPLELVRIPAGSFQMGSPDTERSRYDWEGPVHTVNIGYDFYMGKYEITQAQWLAVMGSWPGTAPSSTYGAGDNHPAYNVSWIDAKTFINALNAHITATGQAPATMRLPSEAEWEYACRAGTQTRFYFGDSLDVGDSCEDSGVRSLYMWYCGNNNPNGTKPLDGKLPNEFGLYDMHGNVWEWCEDFWHSSYTGAPTDGSAWEVPSASHRVIRGGDWSRNAHHCRAASRGYQQPFNRSDSFGFRLVSVR